LSSLPDAVRGTDPDATMPITIGVRLITLLGVIVPFVGWAAAVFLVWGWGFSWWGREQQIAIERRTG
jgi:hypothetical protein